jgi:phosphatidylinositol kinase/protein kinase (PI-3  family)
MEKVIFFALVIPILIFVFYMGGSAIMTGFKAKMQNKNEEEEIVEENEINNNSSVSDELTKLNELKNKGILTQEEFEKAKTKLLR